MIRRPKFKSHLRVETVPPDLVHFHDEAGQRVLKGHLTYTLARLINGRNTVSDIAKQVEGHLTRFDIECGLLLLENEGYVLDASDPLPIDLQLLRDSLGVEPKLFLRRLNRTRISVTSFGPVSPLPLISILRASGVCVGPDGDLSVVVVNDYLHKELEAFNTSAIRIGRPWLIVKPIGPVLWLGPIFTPDTACWECLSRRLRQNGQSSVSTNARGIRGADSQSMAALSITMNTALNMAALLTLKWVVRLGESLEENALLTLSTTGMKLEKHAVVRLDDCGSCARPSRKRRNRVTHIRLRSCQKFFTSDGGHRTVSADTTIRKYQHHISPITGIVHELRSYHQGEDGVVNAYLAGHTFVGRPEDGMGARRQSAGKGITAEQARASALCEALERYSGIFRGNEPRRKAAYEDLGDKAIHPNLCMRVSQNQYERRVELNRHRPVRDRVPVPFDEKSAIEWSPIWSLTSGDFKYLPTAFCYYGYVLPAENEFCRADSNGSAAGNALEEAILQGFMELVERDSTALWWYNRVPRAAVDLDSFAHPYFAALRSHYHKIGREMWVLDITNDFEIPAFVALSASPRSHDRNFILGMGAHFDPTIALARALTEMNQFLPGALSGSRHRVLNSNQNDLVFLSPDSSLAPRSLNEFTLRAAGDLRDDVTTCVELARERGMETLVLDQTRADVGLAVVKVIVPGLRQQWARFGEGRLYDVPVAQGWLKRPLTEDQLNPLSLFV